MFLRNILPHNVYSFLYEYDDWIRIFIVKKILNKIDPLNKKSIINIGGGWGKLESGLKRRDIVIYEPNSAYIELAKKNVDKVIIGEGENIHLINDNAFNISISIHTFEHIQKNKREAFFHEMNRIANEFVILIFPYDYFAEKLCKDILRFCKVNKKDPSQFTLEHLQMGLPNNEELQYLLKHNNKFTWEMEITQNYFTDKFLFYLFYSNFPLIRLILLPINSIIAFLFRNFGKAKTTMLLTGQRKNS